MADQGKWFKLWCSSLRDDDLENLSIHEWFAWARFGTHMKENGKDGKIRLREPATSVVNLLRVPTFKDVIDLIKRFPNYQVDEDVLVTANKPSSGITVSVKCRNWNKYQGDWSRDRVRKHRLTVTANVTAQEEKRSRREVEEKLTTTPISPQGGNAKVLEWFEKTWLAYPKERRVFKRACLRSYQKDVKTLEEAKTVARALDNYLRTETVKNGFIKNASTFFANWRDFANDERGNNKSIHNPQTDGKPEGLRSEHGEGSADANNAVKRLADSKAF